MPRHASTAPREGTRLARVTAVLGLFLAATLTACGSEGDETAASEGSASEGSAGEQSDAGTSQEDQILAFYQCLRDQGIDVEDPQGLGHDGGMAAAPDGIDPDDPQHREAVETCQEELPPIEDGADSMGENLADTESMIEFVECMRDNGFDMPDPDSEGGLTIPEGVDPDSAKWKDALEECQEHISGGGVRIRR
ncbi:hypothetical protein EF847_16980 [Actinobacteria bacterium YIM 96077]|uniref:Uncharacterized protein n=1 Tax=Phytoactinopolyspora halophila TaxID=1981511 RepID=A0A329QBI6_9ACTN|nr:hypothetical protein [Phytoactinopolyspora halophila]AYY14146.1 hypothetical protein EF847_16980 [Actinobacteria bacterium YIM 96077]RAW09607.1 hypothetical protein DPM12_20715 [Phytoactinopolyspora halophila]